MPCSQGSHLQQSHLSGGVSPQQLKAKTNFCSWSKDPAKKEGDGGNYHCFNVSVFCVFPVAVPASYSPLHFQKTDGLPCPWRKSSFCIDTARLDFYRASEIILKHKTGLLERASHGICSISLGQSPARAYLAGLFEEPTIH